MTSTDILERPISQLYDESPATMKRLLHLLSQQTGTSFCDTVENLNNATKFVMTSVGASKSARTVLEVTRGVKDVDAIEGELKVLDRRDEALALVQSQDPQIRVLEAEPTDGAGRVRLLDQGQPADGDGPTGAAPLQTDIGKVLGDPQEFERRLQRARAAAPGAYEGDEGRARFGQEDRRHAEANLDLVRSLERPREEASARAKTAAVAQKLDAAISKGRTPRLRLLLLDAEISRLGLTELEATSTATPGEVRLLESLAAEPEASKDFQAEQRELDQHLRRRLEAKGLDPERDYARELDAMLAEDTRTQGGAAVFSPDSSEVTGEPGATGPGTQGALLPTGPLEG